LLGIVHRIVINGFVISAAGISFVRSFVHSLCLLFCWVSGCESESEPRRVIHAQLNLVHFSIFVLFRRLPLS